MPADFAKIALLDRLYKLRRDSRRLSASVVTSYSINLPFYEDVVLRHLEAAGSRLNVVLVDGAELAKSFLVESTRPRRAGRDYVLVPMSAAGAFHPKIICLFSEEGMRIAVGSHNLTEAGFGRNGEISAIFGFDQQAAPLNIGQPIADYLIQCAGELAVGDATLSRRLADRLQMQSRRGDGADSDLTFIGTRPGAGTLLDTAFNREEVAAAGRILVLGPYFDDDLRFLAELRKRAPRAELVVGLQPEHTIMRRPDRLPARTRLCNAAAMGVRQSQPFIHAKAIVLETGKQMVVVIGSANPSGPAWMGNSSTGNFEAVIAMRREAARKAIQALALDRLWDAPPISKEQLKQIEARSKKEVEPNDAIPAVTVRGLWKEGWVEAQLEEGTRKIYAIRTVAGSASANLELKGAAFTSGLLRFAAPEAGVFAVDFGERRAPILVIASSVAELSRTLVSAAAGRLIDELGKLGDGTAPGEELLNLCEKVLLQPDEEAETKVRSHARRSVADSDGQPPDTRGPRGISIHDIGTKSRRGVNVSLDISAIITLLLKELEVPTTDKADPTPEEDENTGDGTPEDEKPGGEPAQRAQWEDIVRAIRPRVRRLLNRLSDRIEEDHPAKWKYERVLVLLALLKRLRRYHPGATIPFTGRPERLVDEEQLRDALKLAMHCYFARDSGVVSALEVMGGVDTEYEIIGRSLLLWVAYESGVDVAQPLSFNIDREELRAIQADRTDALIASIAASASPETLERARREIFDRGAWAERCDSTEKTDPWFKRHARIGQAIQNALITSQPSRLPVISRPPSLQDIVVWKNEPGWPRFPEMISGRTVHLADVGDAEPLRIAQQFVQAIDVDALGIRAAFNPFQSLAAQQALSGRSALKSSSHPRLPRR
jgi:hypothetical protein